MKENKCAHFLGNHKGKRVYRFPVTVTLNESANSGTWLNSPQLDFTVVGHNAGEVANYVRRDWQYRPETEIRVFGPKGGHCSRYVGWESAIGATMLLPLDARIQTRNAYAEAAK